MKQPAFAFLLLASSLIVACSKPQRVDPPGWRAQVAHGKDLIRAYGCQTCHQIPGVVGAVGTIGPSLDQIGDKYYLAGELPNSSENLRLWIQHPHAINSRTVMPDMNVTDADAADIASFLETLK
jgi:cytochrome c1